MPKYLAPGVYLEEHSVRPRPIEGVSTTTTGFIGPTHYGPVHLEPGVITSLSEFERVYGDGRPLRFADGDAAVEVHNYLWQAVRAFFNEGGRRLYVSRLFRRLGAEGADGSLPCDPAKLATTKVGDCYIDGHGRFTSSDGRVSFRARYPGAEGNLRLRFTLRCGRSVPGTVLADGTTQTATGVLAPRDLVWIQDESRSPTSPPEQAGGDLWIANRADVAVSPDEPERDPRQPARWRFEGAAGGASGGPLAGTGSGNDPAEPGRRIRIHVVTLSVTVHSSSGAALGTWNDVPLDPAHRTAGALDSVSALFGAGAQLRAAPVVVELGTGADDALDIVEALFGDQGDPLADGASLLRGIAREIGLTGGNDGLLPDARAYEGGASDAAGCKTGLKQFEDLADISVVAAPGATWNYRDRGPDADTVISLLLAHAEKMRCRIAVIDCGDHQTVDEVRRMRAKLDSRHGALYYPWVRIVDPVSRREIALPPSGFVAGIYARNDIERGVHKAPANEVVRGAIGVEAGLDRAQLEVLNSEGVNCFRFLDGRGFVLWGARLLSSDAEWKYVNQRRYLAYLERSIDKGTQWAVFETNGERLWADVRRAIEDFLLNEWKTGALLGDKPEQAFFVKCDRSTMSQNDLDNGRLICLIGVAPLRPAEFVVFRIGQWTADRKD